MLLITLAGAALAAPPPRALAVYLPGGTAVQRVADGQPVIFSSGTVFGVVEDQGEKLIIAPLADPTGRQCDGNGYWTLLDWQFQVKRSDLAPVVTETATWTAPDGSALTLGVGTPLIRGEKNKDELFYRFTDDSPSGQEILIPVTRTPKIGEVFRWAEAGLPEDLYSEAVRATIAPWESISLLGAQVDLRPQRGTGYVRLMTLWEEPLVRSSGEILVVDTCAMARVIPPTGDWKTTPPSGGLLGVIGSWDDDPCRAGSISLGALGMERADTGCVALKAGTMLYSAEGVALGPATQPVAVTAPAGMPPGCGLLLHTRIRRPDDGDLPVCWSAALPPDDAPPQTAEPVMPEDSGTFRRTTTRPVSVHGQWVAGIEIQRPTDEHPIPQGRIALLTAPTDNLQRAPLGSAAFDEHNITGILPGFWRGEPAMLLALAWAVEGAAPGRWAIVSPDGDVLRGKSSGAVPVCWSVEDVIAAANQSDVIFQCGSGWDPEQTGWPEQSVVHIKGFRPAASR